MRGQKNQRIVFDHRSIVFLLDGRRAYGDGPLHDIEIDPAKLLYVTMGFAPVGIRRRYYRDNDEDAIVMVKRLNERKPS